MRSSALLSLLPILATLPLSVLAHSHHGHHGHSASARKSLAFGPALSHAKYSTNVVDGPTSVMGGNIGADGQIDVKQVAIDYIRAQVGNDFFVRPDVSELFWC